MAISAFPFDGDDTTEAQYSALFRELQDSGVADEVGGTGFEVTALGDGMKVYIAAGFAIVRGHAVASTEQEERSINPAAAERIDSVVLRLDPAANAISIEVVEGVEGSGSPPALTQTDTDVFEVRLANVVVGVGAVVITPDKVSDTRSFLGHRVGAWRTSTRPENPRYGRLGVNYTTGKWEWWNGFRWVSLAPSWDEIEGTPGEFPPASHSHSWSSITGKPSSFPPASHSHSWSSITGRPSSFPPASHTHSASHINSGTISISRLPVGTGSSHVARGNHSHSPPSTVDWANGSKRVRDHNPTGSKTWYSVWVDGNDRFCKNTSSARYKKNIQDADLDPGAVLKLRPRRYDRRDDGPTGEFGLIAEEVAEHLPEIVVYDDRGEPDAVRYDLLATAMVPLLRRQEDRIRELEARLEELGDQVDELHRALEALL